MPSIQIKNVPDDTHQALQRLAKASGQSLQEFLQAELRRIADREIMREIFAEARADGIEGLSAEETVRLIHTERRGD